MSRVKRQTLDEDNTAQTACFSQLFYGRRQEFNAWSVDVRGLALKMDL